MVVSGYVHWGQGRFRCAACHRRAEAEGWRPIQETDAWPFLLYCDDCGAWIIHALTEAAYNRRLRRYYQDQYDSLAGLPPGLHYLGSYEDLDPCHRRHEDSGVPDYPLDCELFWEALYQAAADLGGAIVPHPGDEDALYYQLPRED